MASDSDNDSDTSISSEMSIRSARGKKRNHEETVEDEDDDEDSDTGSVTAKKARVSNSRSTGLKEVSHDASSLPTPAEDDEEVDWGDLEADLEEELAREAEDAEDAE